MRRPGRRPKKPMTQVIADQQKRAEENKIKRAKNLQRLVESTDPATAQYLMQNVRAFKETVESHGINDPQTLRVLLAKKAQQ